MSARDVTASAHDGRPLRTPRAARARLAAADDRVVDTQIVLSEIPAPTGAEQARGNASRRASAPSGSTTFAPTTSET